MINDSVKVNEPHCNTINVENVSSNSRSRIVNHDDIEISVSPNNSARKPMIIAQNHDDTPSEGFDEDDVISVE
jgi:hypothetical protein